MSLIPFVMPVEDAGGAYVANDGVDCTAVGDYVHIDSTGWTNTGYLMLSMWAYVTSVGSTRYLMSSDGSEINFYVASTEKLNLKLKNAAGTLIVNMKTASPEVPQDEWCHLAACVDLPNQTAKLFVNGSLVVETAAATDDDINFSANAIGFGAQADGGGHGYSYIQECYMSTKAEDYLDLDGSNMDLFFDATGGLPVDLGTDGSTPSGFQPDIYLNNAYSTFATNKGGIGNFTDAGVQDGSAVGSPELP